LCSSYHVVASAVNRSRAAGIADDRSTDIRHKPEKTHDMVKLPIYMDNHATTPVDPRVLQQMLPFFSEKFGNAASKNHGFGVEAAAAVETARRQVADLIGASEREIIFTSGATESNNLAIKGIAARHGRNGRIVTVATEHKAVLDPCKRLTHEGGNAVYLPVDSCGIVDPQAVADAIDERTILVSVMAANNEIGVLQPLAEIGRVCKGRDVILHSDAAQAAGIMPLDVDRLGVDLMSLSAHKMYGPKGIGALYVRRREPRVTLTPMIDGGGQERGLRSGTLPVPLIVGFGAACEIARREREEEARRLARLRDRLWQLLAQGLDGVRLNGHPSQRLPGNLNVSFAGVKGEALMIFLKQVALSSGSACTSARISPSHVLRAIGLDEETADSSLRFGLGRFNTQEEVEWVAAEVIAAVNNLRRR
jgi:cysteine desulfurase